MGRTKGVDIRKGRCVIRSNSVVRFHFGIWLPGAGCVVVSGADAMLVITLVDVLKLADYVQCGITRPLSHFDDPRVKATSNGRVAIATKSA